jgi:hypothetical protein
MKQARLVSRVLLGGFLAMALHPALALAGDQATIIFKSGQVLVVGDGYRAIVDAMRKQNESAVNHRVVELTLGGSEVVLNAAEVVMVCRDACKGMSILHQLDPKRGGQAKTTINLDDGGRREIRER